MADFSLSPQPTSDLRAPPSPLSEILSFREEDDEEEEQEEDMASTTPGTVKKQQRKRWKKPADHPKRPLSAYNLFFQWGRERLLAGESLIPLQQADIDRIDVDTRRHAKRRHRREHGVIGFTELAKMLGTKWKELDPESKEMFQRRADVEKIRYEKAVSLYKAEKGELSKDSKLKEAEAAPSSRKAKKLVQQRKKPKSVETSQDITTSKQKLTLREDVETTQPQTYDFSSALYRQTLGGNVPLSQGIYSGLHRGENDPYFFDQQRLYASRNQVSSMHSGMSLSAQSTFLPPAVNQASYIQSNSAAGSGTSLRDYVDSMGPPPLQSMQSVWGTGAVTNMSSQAYHSLRDQAYHNTNYADLGRFSGTEVPNHSYYSMPLYGQQLRSDQSMMGLQPQNSSYAQYPSFSRYPSTMDPLNSGQPPTNLAPSQMHPGMRDEVDGLSSISPLNYFD
ncbi:hypothetical protein FisN_2Hh245 [Fistulifera solaris]|uniref:HMG box domain-containing protein n=1 Tax=Fistulifera solaris TaxID=1519565 RepID=A0A1Z5JEH9_FISSO|nr:hypothetical protein FisN_2Hh245 [Fistulifera solaris]|eukprot:GAX12414.1 hypothetical protein FisN_2Hh245 [Fistulifera solaris]